MNKLKRLVAKSNAAKYMWPKGWMTREEAADELECSPTRVDEILRLSIADGNVKRTIFSVWSAQLERVVKLPGYREAKGSEPNGAEAKESGPTSSIDGMTADHVAAVLRSGVNCGNNPSLIKKNLTRKWRGVSISQIRTILGVS